LPCPEFVIETHADGFGFLNPEKFKAGFAADAREADAAFLRDSQVPINLAVFGTKLSHAAWRSVCAGGARTGASELGKLCASVNGTAGTARALATAGPALAKALLSPSPRPGVQLTMARVLGFPLTRPRFRGRELQRRHP
jgi:hypothetical protein